MKNRSFILLSSFTNNEEKIKIFYISLLKNLLLPFCQSLFFSLETKPELSFVGAEEEYAPRPLGELLRNFLSSCNEPLAVAYRERKNRKL